jgi:hypothetical protein
MNPLPAAVSRPGGPDRTKSRARPIVHELELPAGLGRGYVTVANAAPCGPASQRAEMRSPRWDVSAVRWRSWPSS